MPELANGKYVSQSDAIRQWWPAARTVLVETAGEYGAWISYQELSDRIQASTGITTNQLLAHWIGRVLGAVADDAALRGEPRLTSLCVTAERLIGEGYPGVPAGTDARTRQSRPCSARIRTSSALPRWLRMLCRHDAGRTGWSTVRAPRSMRQPAPTTRSPRSASSR